MKVNLTVSVDEKEIERYVENIIKNWMEKYTCRYLEQTKIIEETITRTTEKMTRKTCKEYFTRLANGDIDVFRNGKDE